MIYKSNNDKVSKTGDTFGLYTSSGRQAAVINRFDTGTSAAFFSLEPGSESDPYYGGTGAECYVGSQEHPFTSMYFKTTNINYMESAVNLTYLNNKSLNQGSGSLNIPASYGGGNIQYLKKNGIVRVLSTNHQYTGLAANTEVTLGFLPIGYRPEIQVVIPDYSTKAYFNIQPDGEVRVKSTQASPYLMLYVFFYAA